MALGQNFPVSDYYADKIINARTISRSSTWWTAILALEDPKSGKSFLCFYRWQLQNNKWKTNSRFRINSLKDADALLESLGELKTIFL